MAGESGSGKTLTSMAILRLLATRSLRGTGRIMFGGRDPRALYAAVADGDRAPLAALQAAHERAVRTAGLPAETRRFTPHVTLARLRGVRPTGAAGFLGERGGFATPPFEVRSFALFSARDRTGGGPYLVEETFPATTPPHPETDRKGSESHDRTP